MSENNVPEPIPSLPTPVGSEPSPATVLRSYAPLLLKILNYVMLSLVAVGMTYLTAKFGIKQPEVKVSPPVVVLPEPEPLVEVAEIMYFCGRRESLADNLNTAPWPNKTITWNIDPSGYKGTLTKEQIIEAFDIAWKAWATHLDIIPRYVAADAGAMVRSKFGEIDGPSKVLAWSELADGTNNSKAQMYDKAEAWTISDNPAQATIDMVRVACHEIGHVIGLVHDNVGNKALMEPTYSRTIRLPTPRDIDRALSLGYKPRPISPAEPQPAPTIELKVSVEPEKLAEILRKAGYEVKVLPK
jgi:hypothetical protein